MHMSPGGDMDDLRQVVQDMGQVIDLLQKFPRKVFFDGAQGSVRHHANGYHSGNDQYHENPQQFLRDRLARFHCWPTL